MSYRPPYGPPPNSYRPPPGPPPSNYRPPAGPPPGEYSNNYNYNNNTTQRAYNGGLGNAQYSTPSFNPQHFGNGAQDEYQYKYSNCTGKRKALLIGINYTGTKNQLAGCINDAKNMADFIHRNYNYSYDDMVILTDENMNNQTTIPTRDNMIRAMYWLVKNAQPNDSLFFHYSGHGGQTPDLDGDEDDGYDEVIYPLDFETAGQIVDDQMHDILVKSLPPGCRLTALFDSCHSATALDLPYVYSTQGAIKEPNLAKDAGIGALSAFMSYEKGDLMGAFTSIKDIYKRATAGSNATKITRQTKTSPADVISLSGCKDSQTSADTTMNGRATGAMSYAFGTVLSQNPNQSYLTLLQNMRDVLQGKYSQKPQLSASHPIDVNLKFLL